MAWWTEPLEIRSNNGDGHSGRWRLTATSDEGGGGPHGDVSHDHGSAAEALACDRCDEYIARVTGHPSRRKIQQQIEANERRELEKLKAKYEPSCSAEKSPRELQLEKLLFEANDLLRSTHSIACRLGREVNWEAFRGCVDKALAAQHAFMYPQPSPQTQR